MENFNKESHQITKDLSSKEKKDGGIFFTPRPSIEKAVNISMNSKIKTILEPSFGSGEFIRYLDEKYNKISIDGVEINNKIFSYVVKEIKFRNRVNLIKEDFLKFNNKNKYDLIIGNPPYFVLPKEKVSKEYYKYFEGRPNIYIIFIIKCFDLLNENGIITFVLPKNFLNCIYYEQIRKHISEKYRILGILDESNEKYIETEQETCIISFQKTNKNQIDNTQYILKIADKVIFNTIENIKLLRKLLSNTTTIDSLNCNVRVGNIVWNQCKNILTNDSKKTHLVYNSDISDDNKFIPKKYKNPSKKNYIDAKGFKYPLLVVNRGYGKGNYSFNYTIIDIDKEYLIENHLIYIKPRISKIKKKELIQLYQKIIKSFENKKTQEFIKIYFGNNAINTRELQYILPIFLD